LIGIGERAASSTALPWIIKPSCSRHRVRRDVSTGTERRVVSAEWGVFLGRWLRHPVQIAAANPSGPWVARAMARQVRLDRRGHVLELGAGTGSLTAGLIEAGCPPEQLVMIERDPAFAALLRRRFPHATVIEGDATQVAPLLAAHGIRALASVVSSLPIKWFPVEAQEAIVRPALELAGSDGIFLQLTNAFASPLAARRLGLDGREVERVWRNFLPVQIWAYRLLPAAGSPV
jgi:phosphatidylethanolamine/phosphatidyl-N-methylethanolamine N-methyltransferase